MSGHGTEPRHFTGYSTEVPLVLHKPMQHCYCVYTLRFWHMRQLALVIRSWQVRTTGTDQSLQAQQWEGH